MGGHGNTCLNYISLKLPHEITKYQLSQVIYAYSCIRRGQNMYAYTRRPILEAKVDNGIVNKKNGVPDPSANKHVLACK